MNLKITVLLSTCNLPMCPSTTAICKIKKQTNAHLIDSLLLLFSIYRCYMYQRQHVTLSQLSLGTAKLHGFILKLHIRWFVVWPITEFEDMLQCHCGAWDGRVAHREGS
jgi:hypothetical protein